MSRGIVCCIVGIATLACFLLLPFMSMFGDATMIYLLDSFGFEFLLENEIGYACIAIMVSAVAIILSGLIGKKALALLFSIIGIAATLLIVFSAIDFIDYLGVGVWAALAGFAVSLITSLGSWQ